MRQAGRYLPEFKEIRKKNQNFIKLCLNPQLVKEITLQPKKETLKDNEIDSICEKIIQAVEKATNGKLRSA